MRAGRFLFSLLKVLCIASGPQGGDDKGPRLGEFRQPWPFSFSVGAPLGGQAAAQENAAPGVVEGAHSAEPILQVAEELGVEMPITGAVVSVIRDGATIEEMGRMLLDRPQKRDGWRIDLV